MHQPWHEPQRHGITTDLVCSFNFLTIRGSANAANWLEVNFYLSGPRYEGVLPPCDHPGALNKIAKRFS